MRQEITVRMWDYASLDLTLEDGFLLSYITQTTVPEGEDRVDAYLEKHYIYGSHLTWNKVIERCRHLVCLDKRCRRYALKEEARQIFTGLGGDGALRVPMWLIGVVRDLGLRFTDLLFLSDIYTHQIGVKVYARPREEISRLLGIKERMVSAKVTNLTRLGLVEVSRDFRPPRVKLSDKIFDMAGVEAPYKRCGWCIHLPVCMNYRHLSMGVVMRMNSECGYYAEK